MGRRKRGPYIGSTEFEPNFDIHGNLATDVGKTMFANMVENSYLANYHMHAAVVQKCEQPPKPQGMSIKARHTFVSQNR